MSGETITIMPGMVGLMPLAAAVTLVAWGIAVARHRPVRSLRSCNSSVVWLAIYVIALTVISIVCFTGLYAGDTARLALFSLAMLAFGAISQMRDALLSRPPVSDATRDYRSLAHGARDTVIMLGASALAMLALETPWNDWLSQILPASGRIEFVIVLCVITTLYFLSGRRGLGAALGVVMFSVIGIAQYFVYGFKVAPIMPSDVLALGTAMAVSGNYEYIINSNVLTSTICAGAAICLLAFAIPDRHVTARYRERGFRHAACCTVACAILVMLGYFVTAPDYRHDAGVKVDSWFTYDSYKENGFLTTFVAVAQDMVVEKPDGYTKERTQELMQGCVDAYGQKVASSPDSVAAAEQFGEEQPCVVAIMNETFSDLSAFEGLRAGYTGPEFFNSDIDGTVTRGDVWVSVNGGGTCNSEFEFLTGNSMAFFGAGMYPYSAYKFDGCQCLAQQFDDLGYTTTAVHPNYATNWKRDVIYKKMGFQAFLSIDDFAHAERVHNEVSDAATYHKVLELLEADDSPQFIFDVTMQNHSGYNRGGIPEEFQTNYEPEGWGDDNQVAALNEYLGGIKSSDQALGDFLGELSRLDRPVVVVFFGDHQPGFSKDINEAFYDDDGSAEYAQRAYRTSYLIWANYDVAGSDRYGNDNTTCTAYLSSLLMESIGAPLSDYQVAQRVASEQVPQFNMYGFSDADGQMYLFDGGHADDSGEVSSGSRQDVPEGTKDALDLLERAQYLHFIDSSDSSD